MRTIDKLIASNKRGLKQPENITFRRLVHLGDNGFSIYLLPNGIVKSLVPFGNDYRLDFNAKGKLKHVEHFHQELIPVESNPLLEADEEAAAGVHTHASTGSGYITPTDIATLLLYKEYVAWNFHVVLSPKWASIYSMETGELVIEPREKFEGGW